MVYPGEIDMQMYFKLSCRSVPTLVTAGSIEAQRDANGYTNPNIHRRIEPQPVEAPAVKPYSYQFTIQNNCSYRLTNRYVHDEDSITSEVP